MYLNEAELNKFYLIEDVLIEDKKLLLKSLKKESFLCKSVVIDYTSNTASLTIYNFDSAIETDLLLGEFKKVFPVK